MIPVNRPAIPKKAARYFNECIKTGWFSSEGAFVKKFEESFGLYVGAKYASSTSSGTAALHLALLALNITKGDEVIVPSMTIASCYFAVWYTGAKAIPVDIDTTTYTIDPNNIAKAITKRTKAIMVVHLYGHPCDMDPIIALAKKHNIKIIEDAAEAHGAAYKGKRVGAIGDIGIFSFYANKIVTCGEGGMVVSKNGDLIKKVSRLKSLNHSNTRFIHEGVGYNYLMSNMQAALGLASLEEIEESLAKKQQMAETYNKGLRDVSNILLPQTKSWATNVYWMYAISFLSGSQREHLQKHLTTNDIQTRTFFYSPKTAFAKMGMYKNTHMPVAETLETRGLYLPSGLGNTTKEFHTVIDTIIKFTKK